MVSKSSEVEVAEGFICQLNLILNLLKLETETQSPKHDFSKLFRTIVTIVFLI